MQDVYVNELMQVLRELSHLLVVKPENLAELSSEGRLVSARNDVMCLR